MHASFGTAGTIVGAIWDRSVINLGSSGINFGAIWPPRFNSHGVPQQVPTTGVHNLCPQCRLLGKARMLARPLGQNILLGQDVQDVSLLGVPDCLLGVPDCLLGVVGSLMGVLGYLMGVLGYPMAWRRRQAMGYPRTPISHPRTPST